MIPPPTIAVDLVDPSLPYLRTASGKTRLATVSLKSECVRPGIPPSVDDAIRLIERCVRRYNEARLHSAIGYVTRADTMASLDKEIFGERDRKLDEARAIRQAHRTEQFQAG